jgi:hypothetical protein
VQVIILPVLTESGIERGLTEFVREPAGG